MTSTRRARLAVVAVALTVATLVTACLPTTPSAGRATPLRRVLILGDSITFGLFSTTPRLHEALGRPMADRGISLAIDGFPGDNPLEPWPGQPTWVARLQHDVATFDPDMIVLQTMLFPGAADPSRQAAYRATFTQLLDVAQSRGAHVYLVSHPTPFDAVDRQARDIAQALQAQAAAGRGISTIPVDWWLQRCAAPTIADGFHLTGSGQRCHSLAIAGAVDQLRGTLPALIRRTGR